MNLDKKVKITVWVIVAVIILVTIALVVFFLTRPKEEDEGPSNIDETYISINDDTVVSLHNFLKAPTNDERLLTYNLKLVTAPEVTEELRLYYTYNNLKDTDYDLQTFDAVDGKCKVENILEFTKSNSEDKCNVKVITQEIILQKHKELFGENIGLDYKKITPGNAFECVYKNASYYCYKTDKIINNKSTYKYELYKAEKNESEIILYDYFMNITDNICYLDASGNSVKDKCNYDSFNDLDYLKENGQKFKHVFKKGLDNNYYFYSSEPVLE